MPTPPIPEAEVCRVFALVQEAIDKGHPAPGTFIRRGERGAVRVVNDALGQGDNHYALRCVRIAEERYKLKLRLPAPPAITIKPNDFEARRAARRGEAGFAPVLDGFEVSQTSATYDKAGNLVRHSVRQTPERGPVFDVPEGAKVARGTAQIDAEGRIERHWIKYADDQPPDPAKLLADFQEAFKDFAPAAKPQKAPKVDRTDLINLYPWSDPHIGLLIWGKEAKEDWDIKIAVGTFERVFDSVIERSPRTQKAVLIVGGDTIHSDTNENVTPRSRHPLQVDGRHQKVFLCAGETIVNVATRALYRHAEIEIEVLPGNHDPTSAFPLAAFLHAWFRKEPRVTVSLSPSVHRFNQFGKVGFGFTHGHTLKKADLHTVFAQTAPKIWGETTHRYFHTFHVHHDSVIDKGGCRVESHGVLVPPDVFAYSAGYCGNRNQKSITYHRERGWHGSIVETIG